MKAASSNDGVSTVGGSNADASLERLGNRSSIARRRYVTDVKLNSTSFKLDKAALVATSGMSCQVGKIGK